MVGRGCITSPSEPLPASVSATQMQCDMWFDADLLRRAAIKVHHWPAWRGWLSPIAQLHLSVPRSHAEPMWVSGTLWRALGDGSICKRRFVSSWLCLGGKKQKKSLHYKTALITGNRQSRKVQRIQDVDVTKSPGQSFLAVVLLDHRTFFWQLSRHCAWQWDLI